MKKVFTSILNIIERERKSDSFESVRGLGKNNMLLSLAFSISLLSMAGIPPLAGFMAKYYLFVNVWNSYPWLVIVAIVTSAVSISYYLKPIIAMWFYKPEHEVEEIKLVGGNISKHIEHLRKEMLKAAGNLEFEKAASLRDEIHKLESVELGVAV